MLPGSTMERKDLPVRGGSSDREERTFEIVPSEVQIRARLAVLVLFMVYILARVLYV
jgi:hypothetical protein